MREYIAIGSTPTAEDCAQVGTDGYWGRAKQECKAYIGLLRRTLGPEPTGAWFAPKSFSHDFGTYIEVVVYYDDQDEAAVQYALKAESDGPEVWDEQAKRELGLE